MTALARGNGAGGALFEMSGEIPNNGTWAEDIYFSEAGAPLDISGLDWKLTFRSDPLNTSADLTLSTSDGTLEVVEDDDGFNRVLRIAVAAGELSSYRDDYIADLASQDVAGAVTLYAHGIVTFTQNPVVF